MILPIIVLVLLLGIDLGRVFFTSIDLRNAAHEATMLGGTEPDATCADMKATVDRQMGRTGQPNQAVCGPLTTTTDVVYITSHRLRAGRSRSGMQPLDTRAIPPTPTSGIGSISSTASSRSSRSSAS